ncbi:MAG: hypothetical protein HY665_09740 [Chloroflexi bacterium]|nr:hypothetical protein [Chloroflexota bacterium]
MIKYIVLLVLIFTLSLPATALAVQPGNGIVEGQLVNGTKGGSSVAGQDITLITTLKGTESGSSTTKTDAEGRFAFEGLSTEPDSAYAMSVTFQQAVYTTESFSLSSNETTKSIVLDVFDSTTSAEVIKIQAAHTVVYVEADSLQVLEFASFINEGDRTYIGSRESTVVAGRRETLQFFLPEDVTDFQPMAGLVDYRISQTQDGFVDTVPVMPGTKEVVYTYKVDYRSGSYTFSRPVAYPTASYNFLVEGTDIRLTSDRLATQEPFYIREAPYSHLSGSNLSPGDTIAVQFSGLPRTSKLGAFTWVPLTIVVLGIVLAFGYLILRKRSRPALPEGGVEGDPQELLAELARLDDDFESGKINEKAYRRLRSAKKKRLVKSIQVPDNTDDE